MSSRSGKRRSSALLRNSANLLKTKNLLELEPVQERKDMPRGSIAQFRKSVGAFLTEKEKPIDYMIEELTFTVAVETFFGLLGFSPYFYRYLTHGVWFVDPVNICQQNPNQPIINKHVILGFLVIFGVFMQGKLIQWGKQNVIFNKIHKYVGYYVLGGISVAFLGTAAIAEMSLPSILKQKIARMALIPWCAMTLILCLYYAYKRNIRGHLIMVAAFWGLCMSAGTIRGGGMLIGWLAGCTHGYQNPVPGIVLGPMFSTFGPTVYYVLKTRSLKFSYGKWGIGMSAFYIVLFFLYPREFFQPCIPRSDSSKIYPNYPFHTQDFLESKWDILSDGSESLNFCEFRNAISDKTSFQNDLLSSSLKRAMIIDRMDSNKMNFPPEACDDGLPQDFMRLEFMLYDKDSDDQISFPEFQRYFHDLTIKNDFLDESINGIVEESNENLHHKRIRDLANED